MLSDRVDWAPARLGQRLSLRLSLPGGRALAAFAHDVAWVLPAALLSLWLSINLGPLDRVSVAPLIQFVGVMLPVQALAMLLLRLDRGIWRFVSLADLAGILKAVALGSAGGFLILLLIDGLAGIPRAVVVLYPAILFAGLVGARVLLRWWRDSRVASDRRAGRRALVLGAGAAGDLLVRDLLKHDAYLPVGFLDDAPHKQGKSLQGVPVVGTLADLEARSRALGAEAVLIAMPSVGGRVVRRIYDVCAGLGLPCVTLPSLSELASGRVGLSRLRPVRVEDLLGRDVVKVDEEAVRRFLAGRRVLVTGAGGSIGSELVRQIAAQDPAQVVLLDSGEFNLYAIEQEIAERFPALDCIAALVDIRDRRRMEAVFAAFRPEVVVHAAAYKHVPLVESNPFAGVETNVVGTTVVADLAVRHGVATFVEVSTDKAVNPRNVMGASKRVAEIYCQALDARSSTAFITTRFGNVLGSAGSVVPLFRRQIERGGPVTVTHPEITRYFMTIPEAVSLILQAAAMGEGGEIFVLDMGEPVRIADLARQMIRLSGYQPGEDIEVVFTGLRPGEKLSEELFHDQEQLAPTAHPKILRARAREMDWEELVTRIETLRAICQEGSVASLRRGLCAIVPEACLEPEAAVWSWRRTAPSCAETVEMLRGGQAAE